MENYGHLRKQNSFGTSLKTKLSGSYNWKKKRCVITFFGWTRSRKEKSKLALIRYISASFVESCYLTLEYLLTNFYLTVWISEEKMKFHKMAQQNIFCVACKNCTLYTRLNLVARKVTFMTIVVYLMDLYKF